MKIVLASRNKHKVEELQALLKKHIPTVHVLSLDDIGFDAEIAENGNTFADNAFIKAETVAKLGFIGVGDDSGLCVSALNGEPGVYSARYAGGHGDDNANNALLLENLKNKDDRSAKFVCAVACAFPDCREKNFCVSGTVEGVILEERRGKDGFGYDPLFYYEPFGKTFAEMSADEKNTVSHRAVAIEKLALKLKELKTESEK